MTKRFSKILCAFLSVLMVMSILPVSVFAACSHSYTKVYTMENANMHSYKSKCTKCGTVTEGWGYSGWLDHTFNSNGKCTACGYCKHSNTKTVYSYENGNMHSYYATCYGCGSKLDGYGYAGWSNHSFSGNTCSQCGYTKSCSHSNSTTTYTDYSTSQHKGNRMVAYARKEDLQKKMDEIYPPKKTEENESAAKTHHKEKAQRFQKPHQNSRTKDDDTSGGVVMSEENIPAEEGAIYDEGVRDDIPG